MAFFNYRDKLLFFHLGKIDGSIVLIVIVVILILVALGIVIYWVFFNNSNCATTNKLVSVTGNSLSCSNSLAGGRFLMDSGGNKLTLDATSGIVRV